MKNPTEILDLIESRIKTLKIPVWDVYCITTDIYENQLRQYDLEITREAINAYYVIRAFHDKDNQMGIGVVKANSLEPNEIDYIIKEAQNLAKLNITSKYELPQPKLSYPHLKLAEEKIVNNPTGVLAEKTEELQGILRDLKHIKPTFGKIRIYLSSMGLLNSEQLVLTDQKSIIYLELPLKAEESDKLAEFWGRCTIKNLNQLDLSNRLTQWAELAIDSLKAELSPSTTPITAIFPPNVLKDAFLSTLGTHATGRALYEKISKFLKGMRIANDDFSLSDNALMENGIAVANWDGEGNPHQNTPVIQNGIFNNYLFDQKYATLEGTKSTGNAIRTIDGTILNSITNLEIPSGSQPLEELIASVKFGVFIDEFSWLNPSEVTGDFGAEIRNGYLIRNGMKSTPIKGGNLSGNIFEMIKSIDGISKERITEENYNFPYIKFSGLALSS